LEARNWSRQTSMNTWPKGGDASWRWGGGLVQISTSPPPFRSPLSQTSPGPVVKIDASEAEGPTVAVVLELAAPGGPIAFPSEGERGRGGLFVVRTPPAV